MYKKRNGFDMKDVVDTYRFRIQDHIKRVQYFYGLLVNNGKIPLEDINIEGISNHDKDKLEERNLYKQALRYKPNLSHDEKQQIHDVVMEHIKSNPHHCEYWGEGTYASKNIDCTKMTDIYLYEMCCDWAATGEELGNSVLDWCNKVINDKFMFTEHQVKKIYEICTFLNDYIDPKQKRDYGMKGIKLSELKL